MWIFDVIYCGLIRVCTYNIILNVFGVEISSIVWPTISSIVSVAFDL